MSQIQVDATVLLCTILEQAKPEVSGDFLQDSKLEDAIGNLRRERILLVGSPMTWITCPECRAEQARVVRNPENKILLLCSGDCGDFSAPGILAQTFKVNLNKVIHFLTIGLGLSGQACKEIDQDRLWRLGMTEPARGNACTWYFARHLFDNAVAQRLADQICNDRSSKSACIITASAVPLPMGSPLASLDVLHLSDVARLSQSKFEVFVHRMKNDSVGQQEPTGTTLRYVQAKHVVYIDGQKFKLTEFQQTILLALIDDFDHRMTLSAIKESCHSRSGTFAPSKAFERNKNVYERFIHFDTYDAEYILQIPEEDGDWLN